MTTVLVTGAAGYIGSVLTRRLLASQFEVVGLDSLRYGGEALLGVLGEPGFRLITGDVRDPAVVDRALEGVDAVVHFAALVGDPVCTRHPGDAVAVNVDASKALYTRCNERGVGRFVFASTCSNYGKMEGEDLVDETSELRPISLYAETKVAVERHLLQESATASCSPTVLRFATAYGLSPRMRFDLTVNEFTRELSLGRTLAVYGAQFWRPYCHVRDLAAAAHAVLDADEGTTAHQVYNVGLTTENYTKQMLVDLMRETIPDATIEYVHRDEDPRDYRVDFTKISTLLGFQPQLKVLDGIVEMHRVVSEGFLADVDGPRYTNTPDLPAPDLTAPDATAP